MVGIAEIFQYDINISRTDEAHVMLLDLDKEEPVGPNPPPWEIIYINDCTTELWHSEVLPEAHTKGLWKICGLELVIRLVSPNIASPILDHIGLWMLRTKQKLRINDQVKAFDVVYIIMPMLDSDNRPSFRLAWQKDPPLTSDQIITACQEYKDVW